MNKLMGIEDKAIKTWAQRISNKTPETFVCDEFDKFCKLSVLSQYLFSLENFKPTLGYDSSFWRLGAIYRDCHLESNKLLDVKFNR